MCFQKLNSLDIMAISYMYYVSPFIILPCKYIIQYSWHHSSFSHCFSNSILFTLNLFLGPRRRQLSQFKIGKWFRLVTYWYKASTYLYFSVCPLSVCPTFLSLTLLVNKVEKILKGSLDSIPSPSHTKYGQESLFEV